MHTLLKTRRLAVLSALSICLLSGCSDTEDMLTVCGLVTLDGHATSSELVVEPLSHEGTAIGRSLTVTADSSGWFELRIPREAASSGETRCRILIRTERSSQNDVPAMFDYKALPQKTVELERILSEDRELHFALTQ